MRMEYRRLCGIASATGAIQSQVPSFFSNNGTIAEHSTRVYGMRRDKHGDQPHQRISTPPTFPFHTFPFFDRRL